MSKPLDVVGIYHSEGQTACLSLFTFYQYGEFFVGSEDWPAWEISVEKFLRLGTKNLPSNFRNLIEIQTELKERFKK